MIWTHRGIYSQDNSPSPFLHIAGMWGSPSTPQTSYLDIIPDKELISEQSWWSEPIGEYILKTIHQAPLST